jgi:hypothetical protein
VEREEGRASGEGGACRAVWWEERAMDRGEGERLREREEWE